MKHVYDAEIITRLTAERDQAIAERDALAVVVRRVAEACDDAAAWASATDGVHDPSDYIIRAVETDGSPSWTKSAAALRALLPSEASGDTISQDADGWITATAAPTDGGDRG